jgi:hypothetical protein
LLKRHAGRSIEQKLWGSRFDRRAWQGTYKLVATLRLAAGFKLEGQVSSQTFSNIKQRQQMAGLEF